jgi:hypothetical protein
MAIDLYLASTKLGLRNHLSAGALKFGTWRLLADGRMDDVTKQRARMLGIEPRNTKKPWDIKHTMMI